MKNSKARMIAVGGMIAALYAVLTFVAHLVGLDSMAIQLRFSEALTILPVFTVAAIPGLTVGCIVGNSICGCWLGDIVFGSVATLIGAIGTRLLRKKPLLAWIPPVISNMVIVPFVLLYVYGFNEFDFLGKTFAGPGLWFIYMLTVGIGEVISCGVLGLILYQFVNKVPDLKNQIMD